MTPYVRAIIELFVATIIWGFCFIATVWTLQSFDPIMISVLRFSIAFVSGLFLLILFKTNKAVLKENFWLGLVPGLLLGLILMFQTLGLELTSVTNCGFITTLYVVFVPLIEVVVFKKYLHKLHILWVVLALAGTALMVNFRFNSINIGDVFTLICSICGAAQIIWIGQIGNKIKEPFALNIFQCLWAAVIALVFLPIHGHIRFTLAPTTMALWGLLILTYISSLVAFGIQIRSQKVLSPSLASLIYLLESPIAALFAIYLLNEKISNYQIFGGFMIFFAAVGATQTTRIN